MTTRRALLAGLASACATEPAMPDDTIFELRNYVLQPGQRETLIALFEREFIESQEALGSHVRASFGNLDAPDRFVWIRSFATSETRAAALDGFYTGPEWRDHRDAARATMIDTDDVLQLRPVSGRLPSDTAARAPIGATEASETLIVCTTYFLTPHGEDEFAAAFARDAAPANLIATFATEHAPNSYPRLPVRDETVFVTLQRFANAAAYAPSASPPALARLCVAPAHVMRLQPTARSLLR